ncbi:flagellin [Sporomusaceae bacterium BoRhaA]|uniref:flagellin N-terminal helical domain-containing protein n=1 Tax=Pelorhabdus rhamnosifermentans TaxID=2772457 RepID=UPI001C0616CF|nr:flagellin [Pelorhabdus rhamnosifermentans]MBU2699153.1 flagellin [Pelorhabdus rhamnosifermentans]
MVINTNVASLNAWRNLEAQSNAQSASMGKLSSGKRINKAADDAAGLAISEKMISQINGLDQASSNAQDGISLVQTAEGALNETTSIIQRLRQLAVQARNGSETDKDRAHIQKEVGQLLSEVNQIASTTQFNTMNLLNGSTTTVTFQIGANQGQTMAVSLPTVTANKLSIDTISLATAAGASGAIKSLDAALSTVSGARANLGAVQNRLQHAINNLQVASENLSSANSRVRDVDMAKEMASFSKTQVLVQAGTAMLAQANQMPQTVLKLLG